MGAPLQPCAPSVHNQKKRRYDDDGDGPVLGLKEGSCLMGSSPQPCAPIPMDKQKRKRNNDDEDDSKDFLFAKRPRFQPPISRSSESSTALSKDGPSPSPETASPSKDGPSPAPAIAPPSNDRPSPAPISRSSESSTAPPSKNGPEPEPEPGHAPTPQIVLVNRDDNDDDLLVTFVELELELCEPLDRIVFYNKRHRAVVLRYRFAETILKAGDEHTDEDKLKEFKTHLLEEIFGLVSEARRREKHKRKQMEEEDPELVNILTKMKRLRTTAC